MKKIIVPLSFIISSGAFAFNPCSPTDLTFNSDYDQVVESIASQICKKGELKKEFKATFKPLKDECGFFESSVKCDQTRSKMIELYSATDAGKKYLTDNFPSLLADAKTASTLGLRFQAEKQARETQRREALQEQTSKELTQAVEKAQEELKKQEEAARFAEEALTKAGAEVSEPQKKQLEEIAEQKQQAVTQAETTLKAAKADLEKAIQTSKEAHTSLKDQKEATESADRLTKGLALRQKESMKKIADQFKKDDKCKEMNFNGENFKSSVEQCARISETARTFLTNEKAKIQAADKALGDLRESLKGQSLMDNLLKTQTAFADVVSKDLQGIIDSDKLENEAFQKLDETMLGKYIDEKAALAACAAKDGSLTCNTTDGGQAISNLTNITKAIQDKTKAVRDSRSEASAK